MAYPLQSKKNFEAAGLYALACLQKAVFLSFRWLPLVAISNQEKHAFSFTRLSLLSLMQETLCLNYCED